MFNFSCGECQLWACVPGTLVYDDAWRGLTATIRETMKGLKLLCKQLQYDTMTAECVTSSQTTDMKRIAIRVITKLKTSKTNAGIPGMVCVLFGCCMMSVRDTASQAQRNHLRNHGTATLMMWYTHSKYLYSYIFVVAFSRSQVSKYCCCLARTSYTHTANSNESNRGNQGSFSRFYFVFGVPFYYEKCLSFVAFPFAHCPPHAEQQLACSICTFQRYQVPGTMVPVPGMYRVS